MDKYQNKYRIGSIRLPHWDYRWAGAYFITICTKNREHYFGEIVNGQMQFSNTGIIADLLWYQIPYHTQNADLGAFVVMPNHIHGILIINDHPVDALHATHPQSSGSTKKNENMAKISPKPNSVSTIIRSYKSAVTKHAHRLGFEFQWQSRFYDHIIRDEQSFQRISDYILNNPQCWNED
ncbi:MAG: transposase [Flavobacteriales bacterium]|nr:MAG: transposase [Flavobacteriales bacterium]